MSDQKSNTGAQDRARVDSNDPSEVEYVHSKYPHLSHEQVVNAVKSKGPMREDIEKYLDGLK
jgi:hypothetical protein